jgi:L-alanine-DL-glutamate epimerase-like enolase superfamily enzyme
LALYDSVAELPLELESFELDRREHVVSSEFTRVTTVIRLQGSGEEGVGEDVTYATEDQGEFQQKGPALPLTGTHTVDSFSELLARLQLWPREPDMEAYYDYRRWGFESAALDLALRQEGQSLADALGREPKPVRFVVSMGLGDPPSMARVRGWLEHYPDLQFKLDARSSWDNAFVAGLAELGAVESIDLKGQYKGTIVDQPPDPELYRRVLEGFPDAFIEDPALTDETLPILEPHKDRITWDAIIHSVDDVEALPFPPRTINIKPSRFGSVKRLFDAYDYCEERGIRPYGGGQFELGPGRGQIQYLASLVHADAPNDTAPAEFNTSEPHLGPPASPLEPRIEPTGFRWNSAS